MKCTFNKSEQLKLKGMFCSNTLFFWHISDVFSIHVDTDQSLLPDIIGDVRILQLFTVMHAVPCYFQVWKNTICKVKKYLHKQPLWIQPKSFHLTIMSFFPNNHN